MPPLIDEDENEPYTRWQGFRIGQLTLCISLLLTFSVAALGFSASLLSQPTYSITNVVAQTCFLLSAIFGIISIAYGLGACLTRLQDFRVTAQVARHRLEKTKEVEEGREEYKRLGKLTWRRFKTQLRTFSLQIFLLLLSLGITYWPRLTASNRYEVIGRTQKDVPNFQQPGTHIAVDYVMMHEGHKIYATCDVTTVDNLDPNARCGFRPLHTYKCALGDDRIEKARLPQGDLICKDSDDHNVYLYVDKEE
jgi:hypothetical protein